MRPTRRSTFLLLSALSLAAVPGTAGARKAFPIRPVPPTTHTVSSGHAQCGSIRDLVLDRAAQNAINQVYSYPYYYRGGPMMDRSAEAATSTAKSGAATPNYTGTNNQEVGVDEGDVVKTDGRYVYSIRKREVVIVRAYPANSMRVVGRYSLPEHVTPAKLQLNGNKLIVLSRIYEPAEPLEQAQDDSDQDQIAADRIAIHPIRPYQPPKFAGTRVTVLNVRNRTRPRVISETDVEAHLSQSRLIGDDLYFVSNGDFRIPSDVAEAALSRAKKLPQINWNSHRYDWKKMEKLRTKGTAIVRAYLTKKFAKLDVDSAMPRMRSRYARSRMSGFSPMYSCGQLTVQASGTTYGLLNVSHIDLDTPTKVSSAAINGSGWQVYASKNAVYIAMPDYSGTASTKIVKFSMRSWASRTPAFAAIGKVPGHLLNQFAMSEHRGFLRVMTTDSQWGPNGRNEGAGNNLFVLRPTGKTMRIVGEVLGLAEGERIFSARMFGDKGYMVTFRQTDPLFTFDLSNPYKPKMVGELKINGFSSYIHPIDGDRLLTIGRDADDEGRDKGLHLQIFDVSNPAKPIRTHQEKIDAGRYSYSSAQWDHHAFTYDPVSRTLAMPISGYLGNGYRHQNYYSGLEVFKINRKSIDYKGFVTHMEEDGGNTWGARINRSIVIGKTLVSISQVAMKSSSLANPAKTLAKVKLDAPVVRRTYRAFAHWLGFR